MQRVEEADVSSPSRDASITDSYFLSLCVSSLHHGKSSSTGNLLEREDVALPVPDYSVHARMAAQSAAALHGRQQRPYSVAGPGFSQVGGHAPGGAPHGSHAAALL